MDARDHTALLAVELKACILQYLSRRDLLRISTVSGCWRATALLDRRLYLHAGGPNCDGGKPLKCSSSKPYEVVAYARMRKMRLSVVFDSHHKGCDGCAWHDEPWIAEAWQTFSAALEPAIDLVESLWIRCSGYVATGGILEVPLPAIRRLNIQFTDGFDFHPGIVPHGILAQHAPRLFKLTLADTILDKPVTVFQHVTYLKITFTESCKDTTRAFPLLKFFPQLRDLELDANPWIHEKWREDRPRARALIWDHAPSLLSSLSFGDAYGSEWKAVPEIVRKSVPAVRLVADDGWGFGAFDRDQFLTDIVQDDHDEESDTISDGPFEIVLIVWRDGNQDMLYAQTRAGELRTRVLLAQPERIDVEWGPKTGPHATLASYITMLCVQFHVFAICDLASSVHLPVLETLELFVCDDILEYPQQPPPPRPTRLSTLRALIAAQNQTTEGPGSDAHPRPLGSHAFPKLCNLSLSGVDETRILSADVLARLLDRMGVYTRTAPSATELVLDLRAVTIRDFGNDRTLLKMFNGIHMSQGGAMDSQMVSYWAGEGWREDLF